MTHNNSYHIEFKQEDIITNYKDIIFKQKDLNSLDSKIRTASQNIKDYVEYNYLKNRNINDEMIFKYNIAPLSFEFTREEKDIMGATLHPSLINVLNFDSEFDKGIIIPIYENGKIVNFIVRRLIDCPIKYSLAIPEVTVIGLNDIKDNSEIWITEGFLDKVRLENNGFENVVTVSSCVWSSIQLYQLYKKKPIRINIFSDYDYSGLRSSWMLERFFNFYNIEVNVIVSKKCKDADEHFRNGHTIEELEQIFITQELLDTVDDMDDMFDNYIDYLKNKKII